MLKLGKFMAIGLCALAILGVAVFFLLKEPATAAEPATEAKTETSAAPAKAADKAPEAAAAASSKIDVDALMQDRVLGNDNAPVTIIEYASLTCPHCAHFEANVLPLVKARLLDTGKAKLIFRDYPLDQFALKAAMMARCASPLQYFNILQVLFANQDRWTKSEDPLEGLQQYAELAGMDEATFKSCTSNADLQTAILKSMQAAQAKYKVESTPSFIFNDGAEQFKGAQDISQFEAVVNKLTKGK